MSLTLNMAEAVIAAARQSASENNFPPVSITVLDAGAHLLAFARMDGTFLGTIDVAHGKARTAVLFRTDSANVGADLHPNGPAYSLENTNGGLVGIGGGVPLRSAAGDVVGAVGVSGATKEQDQIIAEFAASVLFK